MTKTSRQKQNDKYTTVIEYDKNCQVVFSCDIKLRGDMYKKGAFLETLEAFMRHKKGEILNYAENVVYDENLDK